MNSLKHVIAAFVLVTISLSAFAQKKTGGIVVDAASGDPVVGAAVTAGEAWALTDSLGRFEIKAVGGEIMITSLGYKSLKAALYQGMVYRLQVDVLALNEVIVTATENHGLTASSRIGADAISHIQPSSIADILELLPGGKASDPAFGSPQIINLRSAAPLSSDYSTSALGTSFTIDGKPVSNNANLQYTPAYSNLGTNYVNLGTDMRTISTEDIETVDIVRGIASVENGDLTSGLVKIRRKKGGNDIRARFKSDMKSKLLYVGKGWEWGGENRSTVNASANLLDSQADPRNPRQNFKRLTGSLRFGKTWTKGLDFTHVFNSSLDYTGSFDDEKSDKNIDEIDGLPAETYKSTYNRLSLGLDYSVTAKDRDAFFRSFSLMSSLTAEKDLIDRWRNVILSADSPISISREPGEYDAVIIPARYEATLKVDGRPFYVFVNSVAKFHAGIHNLKLGAEWNMDKNYGKGSIFDIERPLSTASSRRPRAYSDIPAEHSVAVFAEENAEIPLGRFSLEWMLGVRASSFLGASDKYAVNGKIYVDPRANIRLNLPETMLKGYRFNAGIYAGVGLHTKTPTMDMLYPDYIYGDAIQLNYWPVQKELRRINFLVYRIDPTNYDLGAARNVKYEVGADASWNGWSFSADFFLEDMTSGFRGGSEYLSIVKKDYTETAIDKSALTGPPALEDIPYVLDTSLVAYGFSTNGSRTLKRGIEFTLSSRRIPKVNTKVTLNGAWFRTDYMNSQPEYEHPSKIVNGKPYPYVAIYEKNDGRMYESFNTNVMFDTQVPRLGLIFSTSFQCTWFTGNKSFADDSRPVAYIDKNLVRHEYTDESDADGVLHVMVREFSPEMLKYRRNPAYVHINLKITKKFYQDKVSTSLFVNRMFSIAPDYHNEAGVLVRRSTVPYFGMELDFKL